MICKCVSLCSRVSDSLESGCMYIPRERERGVRFATYIITIFERERSARDGMRGIEEAEYCPVGTWEV